MRSTFSCLNQYNYQLGAASALLGITENTLLTYVQNSGIGIVRRAPNNPKAPKFRIFSLENIFQLAAWRRKMGLVKIVSQTPFYIAISSMNVGAGKSTTAAELGIQLQLSGYRVLLIDLDIEAGLTQYLGYEPDLEDDEAEINKLYPEALIRSTFFDLWKKYADSEDPCLVTGDDNLADYVKWPFGCYGPALIPADPYIGYLERAQASTDDRNGLIFPKFFKASAEGMVPSLRVADFDVVLFDCPASTNYVVSNAYAIADYVVAPVRLDQFCVKGVTQIVNEIKGTGYNLSRAPELIFLPIHGPKITENANRIWKRLEYFKEHLSEVCISSTNLFATAQALYVPLTIQLPKSLPAIEYRKFSEYLIKRFEAQSKLFAT